MCLDQNRECREFAKWLLKIGAGQGVNAENEVTLPGYMRCGNNLQPLITTLYEELLSSTRNYLLPNGYFLECTILSAKNAAVNEINISILTSLSDDKTIYIL